MAKRTKRTPLQVRSVEVGPVPEELQRLGALPVREHFWIEVRHGAWLAAYRMAVRADGRAQVAELRLFPSADRGRSAPGDWPGTFHTGASVPGLGITGALLRSLRPVEPYNLLAARRAQMQESARTSYGLKEDGSVKKRPGRPRRPDIFFARLAALYVKAHRGGSAKPAADVARAQNISGGLCRVHLNEARERGLLTRPQPGHSGGTLTRSALSLLRRSRHPI